MKTERYTDLEKKFFEGQTTSDEEKFLKEHDTDGFFAALKDGKKETMNWDFDDFSKKIPQANNTQIQKHKNGSFPKFFWMAASFLVLTGLYFGLQKMNNKTISDTDHQLAQEIQKQKKNFDAENTVAVNRISDTVSIAKDSISADTLSSKNIPSEEDILEKILSKKGRMRKPTKARFAENSTSPEKPEAKTPKTEYQDNFVIINGHTLKNEKEAIDIARYSFHMLQEKVTKTLASTVVQETPKTDY